MDLTKFGTEEYPLRCSALPLIMTCDWRAVLVFSKMFADSVGPAADTGSAVHKAVEIWHNERKSFDDCIADAFRDVSAYPRADKHETELHFRGYYNDPRNRTARITAIEKRFQTVIERHGVRVCLQGTFDQIRLDNGVSILYDVKTGKSLDAYNLLMERSLQLAGYWIGAKTLGYEIERVGIIYTYGYRIRGASLPSPMGVFLPHPMKFADCETLFDSVLRRVRSIRSGEINAVPGTHCNICPAGSVSTCLPLLRGRK